MYNAELFKLQHHSLEMFGERGYYSKFTRVHIVDK